MLVINFCAVFTLNAQELTGEDIIKEVDENMNQYTSYGKMSMTIVTTSGAERTFEYEAWSKNKGEKNLVRYYKPSRVKGQAILMLNNADDIWAFFPRTQRVRKLATHAKKQKMQGSDFTYEDMGSGDTFLKNFTTTRLEDEKTEGYDCYKIELKRKPDKDSHYSRIVMWVIKENFVPVVIDYYDEKDPTLYLKRLVQSDFKIIDGVHTGMKMIMYNKQDNTQTSMEILEIHYNMELDDNLFTERNLKH
jgi:outer membrane lipoprotein-sorting protein